MKIRISLGVLALAALGGVAAYFSTPTINYVINEAVYAAFAAFPETAPPTPSPTPIVAHEVDSGSASEPVPVVQPIVEPSAEPTEEPFPDRAPDPTPITRATPKTNAPAPSSPVVIPQTMLSVGVASMSDNCKVVGPGVTCVGPGTVTWQACFQGGFTDSVVEQCGTEITDTSLTFTWSNGHVGVTDTVAYSANSAAVSATARQRYNGHIYVLASDRALPVIVQ